MKKVLTEDQIRFLRIRAQRLVSQVEPASPAQVLEDVCGVQAQEYPSALLAIHARAEHLTTSEIEHARQQPSIARTWAMRGTLHLLSASDARWLVPLLGQGAASTNQRRFEQLGWDAARAKRGLRILHDALDGDAALTRAEIVDLLKTNGLPGEGQAPIHLIFRAAMEGILCQGPDRAKQPTYVSFERWVGPLQPMPREEALARLAHSYLAAYAPASLADFTVWSGLKAGDARIGWKAAEAETEAVDTAHGTLWLLKAQLPWLADLPTHVPLVHLMPRYDGLLLGYAKRDLFFDPIYTKHINAGGGILHPTLMVNGRILGTWKTKSKGTNYAVIIEPFEDLPEETIPGIEKEAARIARFQGSEGNFQITLAA